MLETEAHVTWEEISIHLPTRPSVRTLQRKWRALRLPIRTDAITGKKYILKKDLMNWLLLHPNKF